MSQGKQGTASGFFMELSERKGNTKAGSGMSLGDLWEGDTTWICSVNSALESHQALMDLNLG